MWLRIKAFDTLFFRTGRPFSAGNNSWSETIFPPYPSTIYGAFRSFIIFNHGNLDEFLQGRHRAQKVIGMKVKDKLNYGTLDLKKFCILCDDNPYFPVPLDLVESSDELKYLKFEMKNNLFISNYELDNCLVWQENEKVDTAKGWIDLINLKEYLLGNSDSFHFFGNEDLFTVEEKIGIAKDRSTFASKEGFLYRIPLIRLKDKISFLVEFNGLEDVEIPYSGVFQLGGEGKAVKFSIESENLLKGLESMSFNFSSGFFKIYFATPAIFKNGWLPSWINPVSYEGKYNGVKLKLVACALRRSVSVGGWDIANKRPKPTRRAIPAGSVYYFKIIDTTDTDHIKEAFHLKNISDDFGDVNYSKEGFGFSMLGEVIA